MLYYIKKTWKNSFLTILCQVISYSIEVFAALASMKMLDGLLAQDTQLFPFWTGCAFGSLGNQLSGISYGNGFSLPSTASNQRVGTKRYG